MWPLPQVPASYLMGYCFGSAYMHTLLRDGYGVPDNTNYVSRHGELLGCRKCSPMVACSSCVSQVTVVPPSSNVS